MMSTNPSNCQGRYIAYSQEIDKIFYANHKNIETFKTEKVAEFLKENPFNLDTPSGKKFAYEKISDEVSGKIPDFSGPLFKDVRDDIAFSVLSSYINHE